MKENLRFSVPAWGDGARLDRTLRRLIPELPARSVRFSLDSREVLVNGKPAEKGRILREGDEVVVLRIAEGDDWRPEAGDVAGASVLYSDESVAVLDKPVNVHTEPHRPREHGTLAGFLLSRFPVVAKISDFPGLTLLTRLDYVTSGAVPAALTPEAFGLLMNEREQGRIQKTYVCLVAGVVGEPLTLAWRIDTKGGESVRISLDHKEPDPRYWTVVTPVRVEGNQTLVRAAIAKGKRHQIRAHLAAAGFPIVGDRRYGTVPADGKGADRLMLHAEEVSFLHPVRKEIFKVASPLPGSFGVS